MNGRRARQQERDLGNRNGAGCVVLIPVHFAGWCSGNMPDSYPGAPGSNPGRATNATGYQRNS